MVLSRWPERTSARSGSFSDDISKSRNQYQITLWKSQLLERAAGVFDSAAERNSEPDTVPLKDVYAKIGQPALEIGH